MSIEYLFQNYLEMEIEQVFDFATMIYCDYGALSNIDRKKIMMKSYHCLRQGGRFLLDVFSMAKYDHFQEKQIWEVCPNNGFWREDKYIAAVFSTVALAKAALRKYTPTIILLDWNMPDGQGNELCEWIRLRWSSLPVIFLTVRGDSHDIVSGFGHGADDYVVKPFELNVLYSGILALLRRTVQANGTRLSCDNLLLDKDKMIVFCNQEEIVLSQPEYQLLLLLMENKGKTVTRKQLLELVWDNNGIYVNDNTLTVTMKRLREKLNNPGCLKTMRSFGYRMEDTL